ncbi:MAG: hypothetical protein ACOVQN_00495 [Exiguobacterium sp.]
MRTARGIIDLQLRAQQIMCRVTQEQYREALQCEKLIDMGEDLLERFDQEINQEIALYESYGVIPRDMFEPISNMWVTNEVLDEIDQKNAKK